MSVEEDARRELVLICQIETMLRDWTIKALTGAPPIPSIRRMTRKERQEQTARLRRFLALSPELQEGALRYGENIRASYKGGPISIK